MYPLINLIIAIVIFIIAAYGLKYVCTEFHMPPPVLWLCGALLLIILLLFVANLVGVSGGPAWTFFPNRR